METYQCDRSEPRAEGFILTGTQVPTRISAPAAAKDFAIAQPYPLSSATPAMNARLPTHQIFYLVEEDMFLDWHFNSVLSFDYVDASCWN